MLHTFLTHDLKNFNVRNRPETKALVTQKQHSMVPLHEWWYSCLLEGKIDPRLDRWPSKIGVQYLFEIYMNYIKLTKRNNHDGYPRFKAEIEELLTGSKNFGRMGRGRYTEAVEEMGTIRYVQKQGLVYQIPSLAECRVMFDKRYKLKEEWPAEWEVSSIGDLDD